MEYYTRYLSVLSHILPSQTCEAEGQATPGTKFRASTSNLIILIVYKKRKKKYRATRIKRKRRKDREKHNKQNYSTAGIKINI